MELYVARHGETVSNIQRRLTGSIDSPLTERGIEQAKNLGKSLENVNFDAVYSSPRYRAIETTKIALGDKYDIIIDDRLSEINLGDMEGLIFEEADEKYPESGMLFFTNPTLYKTIENGEHLEDMIKRISSFLDFIADSNYKRVFVLTHGFALRVLYACVGNRTVAKIAGTPHFSNCNLIRFTYEGERWNINSTVN